MQEVRGADPTRALRLEFRTHVAAEGVDLATRYGAVDASAAPPSFAHAYGAVDAAAAALPADADRDDS